ncbi:MAG TPA: hypothetical protein VKZ50_17720 [bacterium]|nr:hypothetical protein [bacterium]
MGCNFDLIVGYKFKIAKYLCCERLPAAQTVHAARAEMQRAINALEGPGGAHFRVVRGVGNPCHGMPGGGIVDDLAEAAVQKAFGTDAAQTSQRIVALALEIAVRSIASSGATLEEIKRAGRAVCDLLRAASVPLGP